MTYDDVKMQHLPCVCGHPFRQHINTDGSCMSDDECPEFVPDYPGRTKEAE